jgi:hypothetical protein
MSVHHQVPAKVNTLVDRGVHDLIEALSLFPELQTIESCEGTGDTAWVCFVYGNQEQARPWKSLSEFVLSYLGPELVSEFGDRVTVSIQVAESGTSRAEMTVAKTIIPAVVKRLKGMSTKSLVA